MTKLKLSSAAEGDFTDALLWYVEQSQRAAESFETEFSRALREIQNAPERFPKCDERHRYFPLRRFPYRVIYRFQANEVVVIAVAHSKRSPEFWSKR